MALKLDVSADWIVQAVLLRRRELTGVCHANLDWQTRQVKEVIGTDCRTEALHAQEI